MRRFWLALLTACSSPAGDAADGGIAVDGATRAPGLDVPAAPPVRFVMMGDTGTATDQQRAVGKAVAELCARDGCDFVLLLAIPGNHDYGRSGMDFARVDAELAYTGWRMPATHYALRRGAVGVIALDTTSLLWSDVSHGDQEAWWPDALAEVDDPPWLVVVGHHPYRSNGLHGNAGAYDGADDGENHGDTIARFVEAHVCGRAVAYVSAHDHDREWLDAPDACGGTELIVSGAGGAVGGFHRADTPALFQDASTVGFNR